MDCWLPENSHALGAVMKDRTAIDSKATLDTEMNGEIENHDTSETETNDSINQCQEAFCATKESLKNKTSSHVEELPSHSECVDNQENGIGSSSSKDDDADQLQEKVESCGTGGSSGNCNGNQNGTETDPDEKSSVVDPSTSLQLLNNDNCTEPDYQNCAEVLDTDNESNKRSPANDAEAACDINVGNVIHDENSVKDVVCDDTASESNIPQKTDPCDIVKEAVAGDGVNSEPCSADFQKSAEVNVAVSEEQGDVDNCVKQSVLSENVPVVLTSRKPMDTELNKIIINVQTAETAPVVPKVADLPASKPSASPVQSSITIASATSYTPGTSALDTTNPSSSSESPNMPSTDSSTIIITQEDARKPKSPKKGFARKSVPSGSKLKKEKLRRPKNGSPPEKNVKHVVQAQVHVNGDLQEELMEVAEQAEGALLCEVAEPATFTNLKKMPGGRAKITMQSDKPPRKRGRPRKHFNNNNNNASPVASNTSPDVSNASPDVSNASPVVSDVSTPDMQQQKEDLVLIISGKSSDGKKTKQATPKGRGKSEPKKKKVPTATLR